MVRHYLEMFAYNPSGKIGILGGDVSTSFLEPIYLPIAPHGAIVSLWTQESSQPSQTYSFNTFSPLNTFGTFISVPANRYPISQLPLHSPILPDSPLS